MNFMTKKPKGTRIKGAEYAQVSLEEKEARTKAAAPTFFADDTRAAGSDQPTTTERPSAARGRLRTLQSAAAPRDPLFELSTHRSHADVLWTPERRAERKSFEEERARFGMSNLMAKMFGH
ncbi:hypothetical protein [Paraburkholderia terricola]|jgi:hypothetical protein|uniref:hypothetical protein n=1 Tax=Paraburkholderia terricola TaxID=169427 RepID=UPI003ECFD9BE